MAKRMIGVRVEDEFWDELSKLAFLAGKSRCRDSRKIWNGYSQRVCAI